jgi:hypothetical protein
MASIRYPENLAVLTKASSTTATLGASIFNIGAQQYKTTNTLTVNTSVIGAGGVDSTLQASKMYFVFAVLVSGSPALVASTNSVSPSGFTQSRLVGYFYSNATSQILWASKTPSTTQTILTSGSGTYTPANGITQIRVRMVGGGGGGGATSTGTAGNGGIATTFGSLLTANGGGAGSNFANPGAGGTGVISLPLTGITQSGQAGSAGCVTGTAGSYLIGGFGGGTPLGAGGGNVDPSGGGLSAAANTGGGGGGAGNNGGANRYASGAGGAGGYVDVIIVSPTATAYSIGTGGAGGSGAQAGGNGGSGIIIIDEYYT